MLRKLLRSLARPGPPGRGFVAAGIVLGIALRLWVLTSPIGALDADEAVWGLMARHALDGELATFFWGQAYGGTQETLLAAPVLALAPTDPLALRLVPMLLFAVAALLVWRVGLRTVGDPAATTAAVLFWIAPAYLVWKSTRAHGFYGTAIVLALAILLLALRLRERDSPLDLAALGLALGLGWWATPQIAFVAVPALAWLVWRRPAVLRGVWIVLPAFLAGAAPWFAWNLDHGWASLQRPFPSGGDTYVDHLRTFFFATLPTMLGLRAPFTLEWPLGELVGRALEALALAGFVWLVLRRRRRREILLAVGSLYPLLQSISPFSVLNEEPRYLVLLAPVIALLLGELAARTAATRWLAFAAAAGLSVAGLASMASVHLAVPPVGGKRVPADLEPALRALEEAGVDRVLAHYSIAYRITFESDERILATSTSQVRYEPHDRVVRSSPDPAYVLVAGTRDQRVQERWLRLDGYRRLEAGPWAVYVR